MSAPLVVIDADVLGRQRTGDETYVRSLLRELAAASPSDLRLAAITRRPDLVPAGIEPVELPARSQVARMAFSVPRLLRRLRPALAHFVHALPLWCPCPAVVTIQDLSFERDPSVMGTRDRLIFRAAVPRAARRAARVLAISELTKRDLVELYGIPEQKITVTPLAADPAFSPDGPSPDGEPYALFVGALQPRKEATTAIEALSLIGEGAPRLVLVGPDKGGRAEAEETAARLGVPDRAARPRPAGRARRALSRRGLPRLPQPLRGLRPAAARGDGLRHARRRHQPPARCPRSPARRRSWSSPATPSRSPAGSSAPSPITSACARPALPEPAPTRGPRPPAGRSRSTGSCSREDRRGRDLDAGRPRPRPVPRLARAAGGRAGADGQPRRLAVDPRGAGDRQRAHARLRREHQPRRGGHERAVRDRLELRHRGHARSGRRADRASPTPTRAAGSPRRSSGTRTDAGSPRAAASRRSAARSSAARRCAAWLHPEQRQRSHYLLDEQPDEPALSDWFLGAFLLLRREMLEQLGGLDEGYHLYGEDIDLAYRARQAGWERWYVPERGRGPPPPGRDRPPLLHAPDALALAQHRPLRAQAPREHQIALGSSRVFARPIRARRDR